MRRVGLLFAVILAGCGGGKTAHLGDPGTDCSVARHGGDVFLEIRAADAAKACDRFVQEEGAAGEYWSPATAPAQGDTIVCALQRKGNVSATVWDSGGQSDGSDLCAALVAHGGWHQ